MKVLWISPKLPYPPESGDKLRQYNLLRHLSRTVDIHLVAFTLTPGEEKYAQSLKGFCSQIETRYSPNFNSAQKIRAVFGSRKPYYVTRYLDFDLLDYLREEIRRFKPDVIQIEHTYLSEYMRHLNLVDSVGTLLTKHNIDADLARQSYLLAKSTTQKVFWRIEWVKMQAYEPLTDNLFSCVVAMSPVDRDKILQRPKPPLRVEVVENGVDTDVKIPLPENHKPVLLFVGAFDYLPNQDAANYLCHEIYPRLRERIPGMRILLVGRKPAPDVLALAGNGIEVHADVPSVEPYYGQAAVSVVPLRAGSGSRLKILEAMALGRPVVSTTVGAEGLELTPGEDYLRADNATGFADAVMNLLEDSQLYRDIAGRARSTVERKYDWSIIAAKLGNIYIEISHRAAT